MQRLRSLGWGLLFYLAGTVPLLCLAAETQPQDQPKSTGAAINQYRVAVAFQNREVYDLAANEWAKFLTDHPQDPLAARARYYQGVCYFQLKKYPAAQAAFEKILAQYPDFELLQSAYLHLGLSLYNLGQSGQPKALGQAVATFRTMLEKYAGQADKNSDTAIALYYLAESLYGQDNKAEAIKTYTQFLENHPKHELCPKALYGLGVAQQESGDQETAGANYDRLLRDFPTSELATEVGMRRGETLLATGQFAAAEKRFAAAADATGFEFADYALLRQAACWYEQQEYAKAATLYARLVEKFPKSTYAPDAMLSVGKAYFLAENQVQARRWLAAARTLGGETSLEATHWFARSLLREQQPAEALAAVKEVLPTADTSPFLPELLLDQADAMYELPERRKESVVLFAAIAQNHAKHRVGPQAAYMASYAALGLENYESALAYANTFLESHAEHALAADVLYVQAECNLQLRNYEQALTLYRKLLKLHSNRPEAEQWVLRTGLCLNLLKRSDEVIATLTAILPKITQPDAIAEAHYLIGNGHLAKQQFEDAIQSLEASLAASPKWKQADEALLTLARAKHQAGNTEAAMTTAGKLISEFPQSTLLDQAHFRLGEFQYAAGEFEAAANSYRQLLANWPQSPLVPHALFGLGWSAVSRKAFEQAATALTELIEKHPAHHLASNAYYVRAMSRQQAGKFDGALADINAFLASKPEGTERLDALYVRGLCEAGLKNFAAADKTFGTILADDPKYASADKVLYELAWAQLEQKQPAPAAEAFARLGEEFPNSPLAAESLYRVGEFQYQQKRYAEAAKNYQASLAKTEAVELKEKAAHKLAWSYFQQGQYPEGYKAFRWQLSSFPDGSLAADGWAMAGESLFQQKKYEEALTLFTSASKKLSSSESFKVLSLLHAGQAAGQLGKWEQSLELLKKCTTDFPESPYRDEALYEQAAAHQNLGQLDKAIEMYEAVADASDTELSARARFMAGEILFMNRKYEEAIRRFFKVAYGYNAPKSPEPYHKWQADSMFEAARCLEMLNKLAPAKKLYQEMIDLYPQSDKVAGAKQKLATLGGS